MKKITVSAPGKLMLFGEHAVMFDKPCLVTAINQRMYVTAEILDISEFQLDAHDVQVRGYKKPLSEVGKGDIPRGARFVEIAVKNFLDKILPEKSPQPPLKKGEKKASLIKGNTIHFPSLVKRGQGRFTKEVRITTQADFSSQVGFGSSSAVTVCTIKALSELFEAKLSSKEIFDLSYKTVIDVQGKGSGFDVAASVYGGTLYFLMGGKVIEQLSVEPLPIIVCYSGTKADTIAFIKRVEKKTLKAPDAFANIYNEIEKIVEQAKSAVISEDWQKVGALMNKNQMYLRELGVSSEKLDIIIEAALEAGAYGAKLSGAGGGDCIITLAAKGKREAVESAITQAGGEIIRVKTNSEGVRVEN